jgi:hypothetical protein
VSDFGETSNFTVSGRAGRYGENLKVGQPVRVWECPGAPEGGTGRIAEVLTRIHTRSGGGSNYVYVTIDLD